MKEKWICFRPHKENKEGLCKRKGILHSLTQLTWVPSNNQTFTSLNNLLHMLPEGTEN